MPASQLRVNTEVAAAPHVYLAPIMQQAIKRWMYESGRPNRLAALLNGIWRWVGSLGLGGSRVNTLEVRGRRTGRLTSFPVVLADYEGERYVVAMLGEGANWVANVRAAGGQAVLRHGNHETVRLEEVDVGARAPVLRRYLQVAPGARAHVPVDRRAPLEKFERVASQYPVFRVRVDS
ncbi:MAG TPA: nitroreductase/quinone reductase family protein [Solirubrobacteraceae bacterium]|nr:nitroreductase/quinone reductase family protein [Solirubrobacteraceae bacterium]